jgi:hypothetical protein
MENDPNVCYTCPTSKERNGVTAGSFQKHIQDTHPLVSDDNDPPDHTLMIDSYFEKGSTKKKRAKRTKISRAIHDTIVTTLGDNDIKATDFNYKGTKVEPVLRLFPGSHHMCITNDDLMQMHDQCKVEEKCQEEVEELGWPQSVDSFDR